MMWQKKSENNLGEKCYFSRTYGLGFGKDRHRAKEAGFDFHITKLIKLDMLERLLTDIEFNTV